MDAAARNPTIPDYDSGHAVEGGAAAQVFKRFFGTDKMTFSNCSFTLPVGERCSDATPTVRQFTRFSQAADENAVSRIYVGFHFRDAVETGTRHGEEIGDRYGRSRPTTGSLTPSCDHTRRPATWGLAGACPGQACGYASAAFGPAVWLDGSRAP